MTQSKRVWKISTLKIQYTTIIFFKPKYQKQFVIKKNEQISKIISNKNQICTNFMKINDTRALALCSW